MEHIQKYRIHFPYFHIVCFYPFTSQNLLLSEFSQQQQVPRNAPLLERRCSAADIFSLGRNSELQTRNASTLRRDLDVFFQKMTSELNKASCNNHCSLCHKSYNEGKRLPKFLSCFHTFCASCIQVTCLLLIRITKKMVDFSSGLQRRSIDRVPVVLQGNVAWSRWRPTTADQFLRFAK